MYKKYAAVSIYTYIYRENGHGKLLFVFCKRKTEVCFHWSANDKR